MASYNDYEFRICGLAEVDLNFFTNTAALSNILKIQILIFFLHFQAAAAFYLNSPVFFKLIKFSFPIKQRFLFVLPAF